MAAHPGFLRMYDHCMIVHAHQHAGAIPESNWHYVRQAPSLDCLQEMTQEQLEQALQKGAAKPSDQQQQLQMEMDSSETEMQPQPSKEKS